MAVKSLITYNYDRLDFDGGDPDDGVLITLDIESNTITIGGEGKALINARFKPLIGCNTYTYIRWLIDYKYNLCICRPTIPSINTNRLLIHYTYHACLSDEEIELSVLNGFEVLQTITF